MDDYEYCAQWYLDRSDGMLLPGWQGDFWTYESSAEVTVKSWRETFTNNTLGRYRIVKRRKAGPIEVVMQDD